MQARSTVIFAVFSIAALFGTAQTHADEQERAEVFRSVIEQADAAADRIAAFRPLVDEAGFEISSADEGFDFDGAALARSFHAGNSHPGRGGGLRRGRGAALLCDARIGYVLI